MDKCDYCNIMSLYLKPVVGIDELQDLKWIYNWANADVNKVSTEELIYLFRNTLSGSC